jgi:hypothetical protein
MWSLGVAVAAVLLAGCSLLPPPAGIQLTIPAGEEVRALPVTVVDNAGVISEATPVENPVGFSGQTTVQALDGRDDAVVLAWMGGACDDRAIITIEQTGDRYRATVESQSSAISCSAVGVSRAVLLSLNQPVGPDAFDAS